MTDHFHSIRIAASLLGAMLVAPAIAGTAADNITASDPFIRMVPPGMDNTAAYMTLRNSSDKNHKLVKTESPAVRVAEIHTHTSDGGVMRMRPVKDIEIKAKGEAVLKPGTLHIMLIGLKKELKEGDNVVITLGFEDGSSKKVQVPVRQIESEMKMDVKHDHEHMH